jgi:hypothetical protein
MGYRRFASSTCFLFARTDRILILIRKVLDITPQLGMLVNRTRITKGRDISFHERTVDRDTLVS